MERTAAPRVRLPSARHARSPARAPEPPATTGPARSPLVAGPVVLSLDDPAAVRAELVGAKAANLAAARAAGLPTLPGMVLTTVGASDLFSTGEPPAPVAAALRHAWETISDHGRQAVVVRSSSTLEDAETSSMAGRFTSLLDVRGWPHLLDAVRTVLDSATSPELSDAPMAVLIQPFLRAARGGVLFGADPVTGNADHLVVAAVEGGPDQLVSGTVDGATTTLMLDGKHVAGDPLDRRTRRRLAHLARQTGSAFGGPQDMEWAIDADGALWLLQSRPITTPVHHPTGPRFGPGPVAETLPGVLSPLETDLWVDPLRRGLTEALTLSAAVSPAAVRRSPVVVTVDGQVAVDLDLVEPPRLRGLRRIDPRPGARRLRAAWRVGRLRAALPALGRDLVEEVDGHLLDVPPPAELGDHQLLGILQTTRETLAALHGHEILTGLLLDVDVDGSSAVTGASVALQALAEGRAAGLDDETIVERDPVVLALVPPRIGPSPQLPTTRQELAADTHRHDEFLPQVRSGSGGTAARADLEAAVIREGLRGRARWVQELAAAAAWELGQRLHAAGRLADHELVRWLTLDELSGMVAGASTPADLAGRAMTAPGQSPAGHRRPMTSDIVSPQHADDVAQPRPASPSVIDIRHRPNGHDRSGTPPVAGAPTLGGGPLEAIPAFGGSDPHGVGDDGLAAGAGAGTGDDGPTAGAGTEGRDDDLTARAGAAAEHSGLEVAVAGPVDEPMPLPAVFRLSADGGIVMDAAGGGGAQGAGGGTGRGPVHVGAEPAAGSVLVVRTLDPALAPLLPGLGGLVSETGSPLSHLAILAREHGVPTVVGLAGALTSLQPGEMVEVDGTAGTVVHEAPQTHTGAES